MFATDMCVRKTNGSVVRYNIYDVKKVYYEGFRDYEDYYDDDRESGEVDGYEYVDLGLPSGLMWAKMNIGAKDENDYGTYYAWGEVVPAPGNDYSDANCKAYVYGSLKERGVTDANGNLTADYDAATQNWSENWRMPTKAEFEELKENCTWMWTTSALDGLNGIRGFKVSSKVNHNWIFLPAAGERNGTSDDFVGAHCDYWSSTVDESNPGARRWSYQINFAASVRYITSTRRIIGCTVRPVTKLIDKVKDCPASGEVDGYEYVDLGLPSGLKWATKNVGAKDEIDCGTYYAWGEIEPAPLEDYSKANCKAYGETSSALKKIGVIDANTNLTADYDAATQNWSENWRMPTKAEFEELLNNCTWTWTSLCGVYGYKVESMEAGNTNWIFLPAAGYRYDTSSYYVGSNGYYWSSTGSGDPGHFAWCLDFDREYSSDDTARFIYLGGLTVRPVVKE